MELTVVNGCALVSLGQTKIFTDVATTVELARSVVLGVIECVEKRPLARHMAGAAEVTPHCDFHVTVVPENASTSCGGSELFTDS